MNLRTYLVIVLWIVFIVVIQVECRYKYPKDDCDDSLEVIQQQKHGEFRLESLEASPEIILPGDLVFQITGNARRRTRCG